MQPSPANEENIWHIDNELNLSDFHWVQRDGNTPGDCLLGKGSYAEVRLCKSKSNKLYACKVVNKAKIAKTNMQAYIQQEFEIHRRMKHPHILRLHGVAQDRDNVYIYLDYCKNNSLYSHYRKRKRLKEEEAFVFFLQTALGIPSLSICLTVF